MTILIWIWSIILSISIILVIYRCVKGPSLPDRVIALDMFTTITTGLLVLIAHFLNNYILLDVSLVYALLAFISVIAIARYLESSKRG
ncbi:MAG: cation:proton antiporter [Proteobacteria bacterium]|nr:cation:proton antiporter [Pseudomonadota bacterium]